jgi:L-ascorbate metabolism protein UlaG (beta-lactamase superfamily)
MAEPPALRDAQPDDSLLFVGNATLLLRCCGFTVLTDPNFLHAGQHAHLGYGLLTRRLKDPAMGVEELPDLDAVVLSHVHGDHWDRVARRGLDHAVPVVTTTPAARRLRRQGFGGAVGLRTWEAHTLTRGEAALTVTSLPGRHGPSGVHHLLPTVMGSMLEFSEAGRLRLRLYQTGDTLVFEGIGAIARRWPDIDVGVLHLGGTTLPGGLVVTMDGRMGADLLEVVRPGLAVPVHTDDYSVQKSPLEDFTGEVARRGLDQAVAVVRRGESLALPLRG